VIEELIEAHDAATSASPAAADPPADPTIESETPPARVLCIPLRDRADRTSTLMLAQLLAQEGFHIDIGSSESLATEIVDQVATLETDVVVISMVPPIALRQTRLLWRRLRSRYPTLPIVLGCWSASSEGNLIRQFGTDDNSHAVTTLAEALAEVRSAARRVQFAHAQE
jgi:methylmalonyl-CoA mutase cobalamin-binding subunit